MSNNPSWTNKIRQGDFAGAEAELAQIAASKVRQATVVNEMTRLAGEVPHSKYVAIPAALRVKAQYEQGKIQNEEQALQAFRTALDQESAAFNATVQPGYKRSEYDPYIPAEKEVQDYIAERRATQEVLKEEGRRIATINNNPTR